MKKLRNLSGTTTVNIPKRGLFKTGLIALTLFTAANSVAEDTGCDCDTNIYPTVVIADYVLGCMAANGNSFESLHQCSCSIDYIKSKIAYQDYERAQTVMQVKLDRGQRGVFFRDSNWAKKTLEEFEKVQAESTLRCF